MTPTTGAAPALHQTVNPNNNQVTGASNAYDANGNMTAMAGLPPIYYDVENRLTGYPNLEGYYYGPDNKRFMRGSNSSNVREVAIYGVGGELLATYALDFYYNTITKKEEYYYFAGKPVVTQNPANYPVATDRLGSVRRSGTSSMRFYPYGQDFTSNPTANDQKKFGTYMRDASSGLDYADHRYYNSIQGRFMNVDPSASSDPQNPTGWNLYTYVSDDPVNANDPNGLLISIISIAGGTGQGQSQEGGQGGDWGNGLDFSQFILGGSWFELPVLGDPGGDRGGGAVKTVTAPNNAPPQPCSVARALAAVPGAAPTGVNTPVDGHLEVGVSLSEATLLSNGFSFYQGPFGPNGYRRGNVLVSGHVNATSGQLTPGDFYATPDGIVNAQIHFDTFNPASGLFGLIGHTLYDYTIGKLFFKNSAGLDRGCR